MSLHEREQYNETVVKPFYRQEVYDWTAVADTWHGPETLLHRWRAQLLRRLFARLRVTGDVLDLGCGTGLNLRHLPAGSWGVDINMRNVMAAQRYAPNAHVLLGDAEQLGFPDGRFGAVVCTEVLEHLVFPERAVAEAERVLRSGGVFIGSVPNATRFWHLRRFSATCPAAEPFHHAYTRPQLRALLAPFSAVTIITAPWLLQLFFIATASDER